MALLQVRATETGGKNGAAVTRSANPGIGRFKDVRTGVARRWWVIALAIFAAALLAAVCALLPAAANGLTGAPFLSAVMRSSVAAAASAGAVALIGALLLALHDDRVFAEGYPSAAYGYPMLGAIPALGAGEFADELEDQADEAYKILRTNMLFALLDHGGAQVVGITSPVRREGKTTTALNLAYELAKMGRRTLLIEADMRAPSLAGLLRVRRAPGLTNVLIGWETAPQALQATGLQRNFMVLSVGDVPPNPSELLSLPRTQEVIATYAEHFDCVIVDLPPATMVPDALILSTALDGVIVTVRRGFTRRRRLAEAMRRLDLAGANVLGFAVTYAKPDRDYERGYLRNR